MRIGFLGLGVMGAPMAHHVLASGRPVSVHSRRRESAKSLEEHGAAWAPTPRALAANSDMVVYVVPSIAEVRATLEGPEGLLAGADHALLLAVSSTTSAQDVRSLDSEVGARSKGLVRVVDAPVSGGEEGAKAGALAVMVGGPAAAAADVVEVLGACGRASHLGPLGAGQIAKACNQLIVAAEVVANAEAAVIAERSGMDVAALFDLLREGYAGSRIMDVKAPRFINHDHSPSGAAKFMVKDLVSYAECADALGVESAIAAPLLALFRAVSAAGLGDLDTSVVQRFTDERASERTLD